MITEIPPLFAACCDSDTIRYDLGRPFVADGYLWATDARINHAAREELCPGDPKHAGFTRTDCTLTDEERNP